MMGIRICSGPARRSRTGRCHAWRGRIRKLRWAYRRRGKGKRGGLRVIYYYLTADHQVWFFSAEGKSGSQFYTPPRVVRVLVEMLAPYKGRVYDPCCGPGGMFVQSALLVNVDNDTLRRILDNPEAMADVERIEGWRSLGDNIIETIINKSEKVKELKNKAKDGDLTAKQKKQLTDEEKEYKSKRKLVEGKLIKFATRIPAFMCLTDFRENTLQDVITKLEPDMFLAVTGLTVKDFHLLVRLKVFNTEQMNQAVFAFHRYEDALLRYTGIESHEGLTHYGLYDTVVARE